MLPPGPANQATAELQGIRTFSGRNWPPLPLSGGQLQEHLPTRFAGTGQQALKLYLPERDTDVTFAVTENCVMPPAFVTIRSGLPGT